MAAYTNVYMAAIMPKSGAMSSVGSVVANFARTSIDERRDDSRRYSNGSAFADFIRTSYGIDAYDDYIDAMEASDEVERRDAEKERERRQKRAAMIERQRQNIKALVARIRRRSREKPAWAAWKEDDQQ